MVVEAERVTWIFLLHCLTFMARISPEGCAFVWISLSQVNIPSICISTCVTVKCYSFWFWTADCSPTTFGTTTRFSTGLWTVGWTLVLRSFVLRDFAGVVTCFPHKVLFTLFLAFKILIWSWSWTIIFNNLCCSFRSSSISKISLEGTAGFSMWLGLRLVPGSSI